MAKSEFICRSPSKGVGDKSQIHSNLVFELGGYLFIYFSFLLIFIGVYLLNYFTYMWNLEKNGTDELTGKAEIESQM